MSSPFVKTAAGKGLSHRRIISVHVLRPSLLPIVTLIAATAAQIIGGLIIVEVIFEIPGIGAAVVDVTRAKDHNVIVAILALAVLFAIAVTAAVDLLHVAIDPRLEGPTNSGPG
jgi:ABC-type dipeptide/oligopeptide/nickel transport system permease component